MLGFAILGIMKIELLKQVQTVILFSHADRMGGIISDQNRHDWICGNNLLRFSEILKYVSIVIKISIGRTLLVLQHVAQ